MERISTFAQRLYEYRQRNGYSLADLEKRTGFAAQTLNRYELVQRAPKIDVAAELAEALGVNALWLQGYDVGMHDDLELDEEQRFLVQKFESATPAQKQVIIDWLKNFL